MLNWLYAESEWGSCWSESACENVKYKGDKSKQNPIEILCHDEKKLEYGFLWRERSSALHIAQSYLVFIDWGLPVQNERLEEEDLVQQDCLKSE